MSVVLFVTINVPPVIETSPVLNMERNEAEWNVPPAIASVPGELSQPTYRSRAATVPPFMVKHALPGPPMAKLIELLVSRIEPAFSKTRLPWSRKLVPERDSTWSTEFVMNSRPPVLILRPSSSSNRWVPVSTRRSVLVKPDGADNVRLLTVIVDKKLSEVVASMVTTLLWSL